MISLKFSNLQVLHKNCIIYCRAVFKGKSPFEASFVVLMVRNGPLVRSGGLEGNVSGSADVFGASSVGANCEKSQCG